MTQGFSGGCLCGGLRYESGSAPLVAAHCQCHDCRKTSGTGHATHLAIPAEAFSVTGESKVYERPADSGNLIGRVFCPTCGSVVYSLNSGMQDMVFPRASSLDDLEVAKPQLVVYASRGASWDTLDPALQSFETMPPPMEMPTEGNSPL